MKLAYVRFWSEWMNEIRKRIYIGLALITAGAVILTVVALLAVH